MLIGLAGLKGSGKDTVANLLISEYGFTKLAFADAVREALLIVDPLISLEEEWKPLAVARLSTIVTEYGWDWAKRSLPEVRRLMQKYGTEAGRLLLGEDIWIETLANRYTDIGNYDSRYVITDCRFENEVDFVHSHGGDVVWIDRPGVASDGHLSESTEIADKANYILHNDETIEELNEDVRLLLFMRGIDPIDTNTISPIEAKSGNIYRAGN